MLLVSEAANAVVLCSSVSVSVSSRRESHPAVPTSVFLRCCPSGAGAGNGHPEPSSAEEEEFLGLLDGLAAPEDMVLDRNTPTNHHPPHHHHAS